MRKLSVICTDLKDLQKRYECGADELLLADREDAYVLHGMSRSDILKASKTGIPISVLFDRLFSENEIKDAQAFVRKVIESGAETVWVSDPGILADAREKGYMNRIVYHPSMLVTNTPDALFWKEQGCASVCVSPLLTAEEITEIVSSVSGLSLIVHGRLLMSASARKLLSAYAELTEEAQLKNRSVNLREEKRDGRMPLGESASAAMIFTDFIQESFEEMETFRKKEISRFVVQADEGSEQYAEDTISLYRKLIDGTECGEDIRTYREKYREMPFSKGYYTEKTIK